MTTKRKHSARTKKANRPATVNKEAVSEPVPVAQPEQPEPTEQPKMFLRRYSLVVFAVILGLGLIGASLAFSVKATRLSNAGGFDIGRVLPVPMPSKLTKTFDAKSIKQYDGQNGRPCYVAVKGIVYQIKDNPYWTQGKHVTSNGQAYCGADMTGVISKSPHGESVLSGLPKVGIFK